MRVVQVASGGREIDMMNYDECRVGVCRRCSHKEFAKRASNESSSCITVSLTDPQSCGAR